MMNMIFIATVFVSFLLVNKLIKNSLAALGIAILSVTSEYFLFYKDMVHFDQPGLLGFSILIFSIALYKLDGMKYAPYLAAIFAVSFGRGYASYAVLFTWFLVETTMILLERKTGFGQKFKRIILQDVTKIILITILLGAIFLSYNIFIESASRDIPFGETSIVAAAEDRLSLNQDFNQSFEGILKWENFLKGQLDNLMKWSTPLKISGVRFLPSLLVLTIVLAVIIIYTLKQDSKTRIVIFVAVMSGVVWLLAMRNLTAFHDYTSMFYLGVPLIFYSAIYSLLNFRKYRISGVMILLVGVLLFYVANNRVQQLHFEQGRYQNVYTHDFMRIREKIDSTGNIISMRTSIPHSPYAFSFYLPEQRLDYEANPDYIITGNRNSYPDTLTPDNKRVFLFLAPQ